MMYYNYRRKKSKIKIAALVIATVIASGAFGFGGAYVGLKYFGENMPVSVNSPSAMNISNVSTGGSSEIASNATISDVVDAVADSVVEISTETVTTGSRMQQYISEGAGSGVLITVDGYIVTNNHVINGANKIVVTLRNGNSYDAKLIGTDAKTDIAVIKITGNNLTAAVMGNSGALRVGETAIAIGNPLGQLGGTVTEGIISALDREITIDGETMTLLQTSAQINPGNSGGGLFNAKGELIGVVNAKSSGSDVEGLGFAIPINTAKLVIEDIMNYGYVKGRTDDGLTLVNVNNIATAWMYRVSYLGVYITDLTTQNAVNSGLEKGDLIISVNGSKISSDEDFEKAIKGKKIGESVSVEVLRGNERKTFNLTLSEYTPK